MCGIVGILNQDGRTVDERLLRKMTDVLAHRGPDGDGLHLEGAVGLGHRRLAIIDLTAGAQPMVSPDGALAITYNGEVYNYRALRDELRARGFTFRTTSDTEVILRGYEAWGVGVLSRLRGMFAFAIWDRRRRRLFLARDRVGIKPLVYAWDGRSVRFASEIKALLQDPQVDRELDWEALGDYFTYLFVPAPRTIFRRIRKLPPASYLLCSLEGGAPEVHRYWTLRVARDDSLGEEEWLRRLDATLAETVKLHMVSDVPIGAFLSGGIDSSAVVAAMARASAVPVKTFSIGFDEADFDELAYARLVARRHRTEHVELVVKPDVVNLLPRLAWQFDEPFADASAVPTYCVSLITREHVTVALSGDGGDENFGGYQRYRQALGLHQRIDHTPAAWLRPLFRAVAGCLPEGARGRAYLGYLGVSPLRRYFRLMTFQSDATLRALLTPEARAEAAPPEGLRFQQIVEEAAPGDYLSRLQYVDIHHYLPGDILTKVDQTSMLASLESRVPLLDHVLMEFAATIPSEFKVRSGEGKYILKRMAAPQLPPEIVTRPKMGFGVPLARWFRGPLREWTREILLDPATTRRGIINPATVQTLLDAHASDGRDRSPQIWSLVCFALWCRTWLDRA